MTRLGAHVADGVTRFAVRAPRAGGVWLCLFEGEDEQRHAMARNGDDWVLDLPGDLRGRPYGYRAEGEWNPPSGLWFDLSKLLVDPYAHELDRRFVQDASLAIYGRDTAPIVPRALVPPPRAGVQPALPRFRPGGLVYEVNVRAFTMLHPDIPDAMRGTVAALAHPAVIAHLKKIGVDAIELMPIVAWIDERHLPPLGLVNAWGYNPVAMMTLDPGLCPGGVTELRETVAALHAEEIGVLLDLVFNHSGESDAPGGVISLRGLDASAYATAREGHLINDSGCGNTLDFAQPFVRELALETLRHFVTQCGVDGFRFDLASVMARSPGFDPAAPIFAEIAEDPVLSTRVLIAEPWDIGPGGYQLGNFPASWLEWNDRFRDDVRRFWKGEVGVGPLATRLAGSTDVFGPHLPQTASRSVNFLAAHDGFTLADIVAYETRHNWANGEGNRDGHGENFSWNHGVEGPTQDPVIRAARRADIKAMLGTLFASTGTIMLTAGDEFGRSQQGNNNAYCQDNALSWVDWAGRDIELEDYVAQLSALRRAADFSRFPAHVDWLDGDSRLMTVADWESASTHVVGYEAPIGGHPGRVRVQIDRVARTATIRVES